MNIFRTLKRFFEISRAHINIEEIESVIGYHFSDPTLLYKSLKHRSYSQTMEGDISLSNERFEFLGDSVLNMIISQSLFDEYPDFQEGDLTKLKSTLVSKTSTAIAAKDVGIDRYILLSSSEEDAGGRDRKSIIGDAYEAVVCAIFLDGGLEAAREFVRRTIFDKSEVILDNTQDNYKSFLLELMQSKKLGHPSYRTITEDGPDHDKIFTVEVTFRDNICGIGKGKTKKDAQQNAAKVCLEKLKEELP